VKKRMLADVLWEAANLHLSPIPGGCDEPGRPMLRYSCNTVCRVLGWETDDDFDDWFPLPPNVYDFLRDCGCNPDSAKLFADSDPLMVQGDRYMWLLLAMHVAEDEGIEIGG
jgi:hypothetical protein